MDRGSGSWRLAALTAVLALVTSGCAGWGGGGGSEDADSINGLMVNNPQMVDLQKLTADHFTEETGIRVNFTVLPENDVRDKISQEFSSQAGQYDAATVSNFEIPIYARSRWIAPLDSYIARDPGFDQADILAPMVASLKGDDGKIYGQPFLRRVLVPDVPQGRARRQGRDHAGQAHLATGRADRRPGGRGRTGNGRDLPARAARLGTALRPADHGGEHLRRHLVHRGLAGPGGLAAVPGSHPVLRRPGPRARRERSPASRFH